MMALMIGTTSWCNKMVIVGYIITENSNKHQPFPLSFTVSSFSNQFKEMEKDVENKKEKKEPLQPCSTCSKLIEEQDLCFIGPSFIPSSS